MRTEDMTTPTMPEGLSVETTTADFWKMRHREEDRDMRARCYHTYDMDAAGGEPLDAMLLAQVVYWSDERLTVERWGKSWLARTHQELADELGVPHRKRVERAITRLQGRKVLEVRTSGYSGKKATYIRINWDGYLPYFMATLEIKEEQYEQEAAPNQELFETESDWTDPAFHLTEDAEIPPSHERISIQKDRSGLTKRTDPAIPIHRLSPETKTKRTTKRESRERNDARDTLEISLADSLAAPNPRPPSPTANSVRQRFLIAWQKVHGEAIRQAKPEAMKVLRSLTNHDGPVAQRVQTALREYPPERLIAGWEDYLQNEREQRALSPPGWYLDQLSEWVPRSVSARHAEWLHALPVHKAPDPVDMSAELPDYVKEPGGWWAEIEKSAKRNGTS